MAFDIYLIWPNQYAMKVMHVVFLITFAFRYDHNSDLRFSSEEWFKVMTSND